jgi:hypothetical protein
MNAEAADGRKAQSALEYLTTYGWAILILSVVIAALAALGIFNPNQFVTQECLMPADFSCVTYFLYSNGIMALQLQQSLQYPVNVTSIGCSQNSTPATPNISNPPSNQIYMPIESTYNFSIQCKQSAGGNYIGTPGGLFQGYVGINFTDLTTGFPHSDIGKMVVKIS